MATEIENIKAGLKSAYVDYGLLTDANYKRLLKDAEDGLIESVTVGQEHLSIRNNLKIK